MKKFLLFTKIASLFFVRAEVQCEPASSLFPGISFSEANPGQLVELEFNADGSIAKIKKTDECVYSVFDAGTRSTYLEDLHSTYSSYYTQNDALRTEK